MANPAIRVGPDSCGRDQTNLFEGFGRNVRQSSAEEQRQTLVRRLKPIQLKTIQGGRAGGLEGELAIQSGGLGTLIERTRKTRKSRAEELATMGGRDQATMKTVHPIYCRISVEKMWFLAQMV